MPTDLFEKNNIEYQGQDLFSENNIHDNRTSSIIKSADAVENNNMEWYIKAREIVEKNFNHKIQSWNKPMSWVDFALSTNPLTSTSYSAMKSIDATAGFINNDKRKKRLGLAEKYGASENEIMQTSEGLKAQMNNERQINYKEQFKKNGINESIPFLSSYADLKDNFDNLALIEKYNSGQKLSKNEMLSLNGYLLEQAEQIYRGTTFGGKFVAGLTELPAFAGEFLATDGIGAVGKEAVKKSITKGLQDATKKQVMKRAFRGTFEAGGDALARTSIGMPHRVIENYGDRRLSDNLTVTDKGDLILKESLEKPATSFVKAYADTFIENLSELSGAGLKIGLGAAGRSMLKKMPKGAMRGFLKFARDIKPDAKVTDFMTKTGFNGILEEYGEERVGDLLRVACGLDDRDIGTFEKIQNAIFPDVEQAMLEFGLFSVWGGGSVSTLSLANHFLEKGYKKDEVKKVLQSTSELEKEKLSDDLILKGRIEKANIILDEEVKALQNKFIDLGLDDEKAKASAEIFRGRAQKMFYKYGEELAQNGVEFENWYKDKLRVERNNFENKKRENFQNEHLKVDPTQMKSFDPNELKTDAKTFQYKDNADENGVTDRLQGVKKFEPVYAGNIIVYEYKNGDRYIADGHQRLGLAKRLNDSDIKLNGFLYREADGYTPEQVRVIAAQTNIAQGSGTPIDTAKIIREIGAENLPDTLPQNSKLVQNGLSLSRLGSEAFEKIINGEITPQQGAVIADVIRNNDKKQVLAIDVVKEAKPDNLEQVAMYANEVLHTDMTQTEQTNLFGTQTIFHSNAPEKIKIVDRAIKELRSDKKIFSSLLRNKNKIEDAGNKLKHQTNEELKYTADLAINAIQKLSAVQGKISQKGNELAADFKNGKINFSDAVNQFKNFITEKDVLSELYGNIEVKTYNQDDRGSITFENDSAIIKLFDKADASTLPHELAHFFLRDLADLAKHSKQAALDLKTINEWLGNKGEEYTEEQHEQFAKAFEAYLMEFHAPSRALYGVFENFKEWLKGIYESVKSLNIEMSDDVKKSFDDLFMSDEEYLKSKKNFYNRNHELQEYINNKKFSDKFRDKLDSFSETVKLCYDRIFIPIDTRLEKMSPKLAEKLRRFTFRFLKLSKNDAEVIMPFINKAKLLNKDDFNTLDLALKNRDIRTANIIVDKNNMQHEFKKVRGLLDELFSGCQSVGMELDYLYSYFPRAIKHDKIENYLEYIELLSMGHFPDVKAQLEKKDGFMYSNLLHEISLADKNGTWTLEDKAKFIDNKIRGFGKNNILLVRIGQLKHSRTMPILDANLNAFYDSFTETLAYYVANTRKVVEERKFFGAENKEIVKLRKSLNQKKKTLDEVQKRSAPSAKYKEKNRLLWERNSIATKLQIAEDIYKSDLERFHNTQKTINEIKEEYTPELEEQRINLNKLKGKLQRLDEQIQFIEDATPTLAKNTVIKRLYDEIKDSSLQISEIQKDKNTVDENIGLMVHDLIAKDVIKSKDENIVKDILRARFNYGTVKDVTAWVRDLGYLGTLNDVANTITQFGDLSLAAYKNGAFDTISGMVSKPEVRKEDLGLTDIAEEFKTKKGLSKFVEAMFKLIGFDKIDTYGKNVLISSSLRKARKLINKNDEAFNKKLEFMYGEDAEQVKKDISEKNITFDVEYFLFHELTDMQPVSIDQLPEAYAKGGIYRLMYSLKTYTLKMLDIVRKDCFMQMRSSPAKTIGNLVRLQMFLLLFGLPKDWLKDLITNREFNFTESVIDNLVICQLINRFTMRSVARDGLGSAILGFVNPPIGRALDDTTRAIINVSQEKEEISDIYAWNYVPVLGSMYYDWLGGNLKRKGKKEKKNNTQSGFRKF